MSLSFGNDGIRMGGKDVALSISKTGVVILTISDLRKRLGLIRMNPHSGGGDKTHESRNSS